MIKKQQGNNKQHPHTQKGLSVNIIRNQRQTTVEQIQDLHLYILVVNNDNIYIYINILISIIFIGQEEDGAMNYIIIEAIYLWK